MNIVRSCQRGSFSFTMSNVDKTAQRGEVNILLLPLIVSVLLLFGALVFGYWAFEGREDYKNNTDQKITVAVQSANQKLTTQLNAQFAQQEKSPYSTYDGPQAFGSLVVLYPRTWSAYVAEEDQNSTPIDGYFYPNTVPDVTNQSNTYALRVQVLQQSYSTTLQQYQQEVQQNLATVTPYALPKVSSQVGVYIKGEVQPNKQGEMVLLPLRNETLAIWTESVAFEDDFNNIVLSNFTFSP
jgi:cell division protein YceG involved in septum cleavage